MPPYNPMVGPPGAINNPRSLGAQFANPLGGLPGSAARPAGNQYGGIPTGGYLTPGAAAANDAYMAQRAAQAPAGQAAFQQRGLQELAHLAGGGSRFGIMPGVPQQYQSGGPAQGGLSAASMVPFGNSPTNTGPGFSGQNYGGLQQTPGGTQPDNSVWAGGSPLPHNNPGGWVTSPPGPTPNPGTSNPANPVTPNPTQPPQQPPGQQPPTNSPNQPPTTAPGGNWVHNPGPGERWTQNPVTGGGQNGIGLNTNYGASINTSIDPSGIYSPAQTQAATNQAIASQHAAADPYTQLKQTTRPGFSRSASNAALALPGIMQGRLGGAQAAFEIPFLDTQANLQHQLAGETAREGEGIDWGNILARLMEQQSRQRTSAFGPAVGLTDLLLG